MAYKIRSKISSIRFSFNPEYQIEILHMYKRRQLDRDRNRTNIQNVPETFNMHSALNIIQVHNTNLNKPVFNTKQETQGGLSNKINENNFKNLKGFNKIQQKGILKRSRANSRANKRVVAGYKTTILRPDYSNMTIIYRLLYSNTRRH